METNKKSTRELSIEWWNTLSIIDKSLLAQKYSNELYGRGYISLTGIEIQMIYKKEKL